MPDVRKNTQESYGNATVLQLSSAMRFLSISLEASLFVNAKSAGRSKHFNIYDESKHFVQSMLNFRCEISSSLEAFACSASH